MFRNKYKCGYTEKEILIDCIENYIEIANINENTFDDYISIIALLYQLKKQYNEYNDIFDDYLNKFRQKGILDKYNKQKNNTAKKYFEKFGTNPEKVKEVLFNFVDGANSRFLSYLIMIGMNGKPTTPLSRYNLAIIYSFNSSKFCKPAIYYISLYLNNRLYDKDYKNDLRGVHLAKKSHLLMMYNHLGKAYENNKEYNKALTIFKKHNKKNRFKKDILRVTKKMKNVHK